LKNLIHAILWDLDGIIVDIKVCHLYTWRHVLQQHGVELDKTIFNANFGRNNTTLLPLLLGFEPDEALMRELVHAKETLFRQLAPEQITLISGVKSWLDAAQALNFGQAIASSAPMENITTMLQIFNLGVFFDTIVSGTDLPAKPEPEIFLKAARSLGYTPDQCLVIEDSLAGVQAAKNAGMPCIAVSTTHPRAELGLADLVIDDFRVAFVDVLAQFSWT